MIIGIQKFFFGKIIHSTVLYSFWKQYAYVCYFCALVGLLVWAAVAAARLAAFAVVRQEIDAYSCVVVCARVCSWQSRAEITL